MADVHRIDLVDLGPGLTPELRALLAPPERTPEGFLIVEGFASRTGIQSYLQTDGTIRREFRPADEVFSEESLASFDGRPFTNTHPSLPVSSVSATTDAKGAMLEVKPFPEHGLNKVRVVVHDQATIKAIDAGRRQLSLGYQTFLDMTAGVDPVSGQAYDAIQRGIRINHLAAVDNARAGAVAQLRLDDAGNGYLGGQPTTPPPKRTRMEVEITINGRTYTVDEAVSRDLITERTGLLTRADAAEGSLATVTAQHTALQTSHETVSGQLATAQQELATRNDQATIDAAVAARTALLASAAPYLADSYDPTGRSDQQVRVDALVAQYPGRAAEFPDKSTVYVDASFDMMLATRVRDRTHVDGLRQHVVGARSNPSGPAAPEKTKAEKARANFNAQYNWDSATRTNAAPKIEAPK